MAVTDVSEQLRAFVIESNRIEGIHRRPKKTEIAALESFVTANVIGRPELVALVGVFQPDALLRDRVGLDVFVGSHRPPLGGPDILTAIDEVFRMVGKREHPYHVHHAYETLHPFTDGNGRSGRALWLWGMRQRSAAGVESRLPSLLVLPVVGVQWLAVVQHAGWYAMNLLRRFLFWSTYRSPWGKAVTRLSGLICGETPAKSAQRDRELAAMLEAAGLREQADRLRQAARMQR
jgi:hypothetical protein